MAITMEELKRKAKAYDEALESAKEIVNNQNASSVWKDWLRNTFPELKESKGEEIRKCIVAVVCAAIWNSEFSTSKDDCLAWLEKQCERKPAWSEEDDYNLQCMIAKAVNDIQNGNVGRNQELIDWLKSLKDKVQPQPQPKQEWSEEDECYMSECISAIATKDGWSFEEKRKIRHWLKSLKQRIGG